MDPIWLPPIRLRYVLAGAIGIGAVSWVVPRARAAWDAHELGAALADYAVCMAGPSGAQLLRDDENAFRRLVRRRVVGASPNEAPFARCAGGAKKILGRETVERAHRLPAERFKEHGTNPLAPATLEGLSLGLEPLRARVRAAWPFVRGNYTVLLKTSLSAREAVHPVAPPVPGTGRGLPPSTALVKTAWRSRELDVVSLGLGPTRALFQSADGGISFRPALDREAAEARCSGRDPSRGFELSTAADGSLSVTAIVPEAEPRVSIAVQGEHSLLSAACDDQQFIVAARREGAPSAELVVCRPERRCEPLVLPRLAPFTPLVAASFDLARSAGATIVSVATAGIVRVISSRDDGRTWTPPTVAYDAGEVPGARAAQEPPWRLVSLGQRVLLYGSPNRALGGYALLASEDQGASFHSLGEGNTPTKERVASTRSAR